MPRLPPTFAAWFVTILGSLLLVIALSLHWGMFLVVLRQKAVSPGGGEFAVALFGGVPAALLSFVLLTVATIRIAWRSTASAIGVGAAILLLLSWVIVAALWP